MFHCSIVLLYSLFICSQVRNRTHSLSITRLRIPTRHLTIYPTLRLLVSRYIGFLSFNKPVGLTLLKLVKLLGASVT